MIDGVIVNERRQMNQLECSSERHCLLLRRALNFAGEKKQRRAKELATHGAASLELPLTDVMTRKVMTCVESETVNDVMARMTRGRFRHLPVVAESRLAGIISIGDVVKARIEQVEREAEDMRAYIAAV